MKINLGRRSKIFVVVSLILLTVFIIMPLLGRVYRGYITKDFYSRVNQPNLYILPIERKIAEIDNQTPDNYKINYADFEIKLPTKSIKKIENSPYRKTTYINIEYGKGIIINMQPKDNNWEKKNNNKAIDRGKIAKRHTSGYYKMTA